MSRIKFASVSVVTINTLFVNTEFTNVSFISNNYSRSNGAVLFIEKYEVCNSYIVEVSSTLTDCFFELLLILWCFCTLPLTKMMNVMVSMLYNYLDVILIIILVMTA